MKSKDGIPLLCLCVYIYIYICVCVCVCVFRIHVCLTVSSPYLLVFGDDRVRGIREKMMLQVDLMRHRAGSEIN